MLETLIITLVIIACFIAIAWYAIKRSKQRNHEFLVDLAQRMEPELTGGEEFTSILEQELKQQIDLNTSNIDAEPAVTLSDKAQEVITPVQSDISEHIKTSTKQKEPRQSEIDLTIGDDDDDPELMSNAQADATGQQEQNVTDAGVNDWDMVIAFTVMAQQGHKFVGGDLKSVLDRLNLSFGEMNIYHRMTAGVHKQSLFSIANIIDPGTFDPKDSASMTTPGVVIFAKLPGPVNGLTLFDDVLETAQYLAEKLDGVLCDEARNPVTPNTLEAMRSRIFSLNLSLQTEQQ
ncbi:MAG: cell division protein ZipA [Gammaproteobacteria bacterium]|nr:cell division protein ZipA [Gammaproteobacteria bacterium]